MTRTISIDDGVSACPKALKRPGRDTPNQILRRVTGLDPDDAHDHVKPGPRLSNVQRAALDALRTDVTMTAPQVAAAAGIGTSTARKALNVLEGTGMASRHRVLGGTGHHGVAAVVGDHPQLAGMDDRRRHTYSWVNVSASSLHVLPARSA